MITNIQFSKSKRKHKKYKVTFNFFRDSYVLHFGDKRYEHYKDQTPLKLFSNLDHLDKKRRDNFHSRFNSPAKDDPRSPLYWSAKFLW